MMLKGSHVVDRRQLHRKITELQRAGKTDHEAAEILGITYPTLRYVASSYPTEEAVEGAGRRSRADERPRLAYEMRQAGKSFTEISQTLNISRPRAHQIVHKYEWGLHRLKRRVPLEH